MNNIGTQLHFQRMLSLPVALFLLIALGFGSSKAEFIANQPSPVNYLASSGGDLSSWTDSSGDFSCSGFSGGQKIISKDNKPLSVNNSNDWPDTCQHLRQWASTPPGHDTVREMLRYDTLRLYIEHCAVSDTRSWSYFGDINGSVQFMSSDTNRFFEYRTWLLSVLYLNTIQEEYFCACMGSIISTFQYGKNKILGGLAIMDYLRTNHSECWGSSLDKEYTKDSLNAFIFGYDPTHLPSMDSLGLGFLLKSAVSSPGTIAPSEYIASFTSSPNPFKDETKLRFHLNRVSYVNIQVSDLLGRVVWESKGKTFNEGDNELTVDGNSLPEGSLYARISTGFGEVKTVKLIKRLNRD